MGYHLPRYVFEGVFPGDSTGADCKGKRTAGKLKTVGITLPPSGVTADGVETRDGFIFLI